MDTCKSSNNSASAAPLVPKKPVLAADSTIIKALKEMKPAGLVYVWKILVKRGDELKSAGLIRSCPWEISSSAAASVASVASVVTTTAAAVASVPKPTGVVTPAAVEIIPKPANTFNERIFREKRVDEYSTYLCNTFFTEGSRVRVCYKQVGYKIGTVRYQNNSRVYVPVLFDDGTRHNVRARGDWIQKLKI
jgi:hypothetical protein